MNTIMRSIWRLTAGIILIYPLLVVSAGLEVSPSRVEIEAEAGKQASAELRVVNPTADVQLFEVYADDFVSLISVRPSSFTLDADSAKDVIITIDTVGPSSIIQTNISIVAKPISQNKFQQNTGAKVPLTVNIDASKLFFNKTAIRYIRYLVIAVFLLISAHWLFKRLVK